MKKLLKTELNRKWKVEMNKDSLYENTKKVVLTEIKQGKLRKILGLKDGESIEDAYTSGTKLAATVLKKVDYEAAIKMLVFAANMNPDISVLKSAVNACKRMKED